MSTTKVAAEANLYEGRERTRTASEGLDNSDLTSPGKLKRASWRSGLQRVWVSGGRRSGRETRADNCVPHAPEDNELSASASNQSRTTALSCGKRVT